MFIYEKISSFFGISSKTSSDFSSIFMASLFNNGVNFLINLYIAKYYGQDFFGLFSVVVNVTFTIYLLTELGLNLTTVRLVREDIGLDKSGYEVIWNVLTLKIVVFCILLILVLIFARPIAAIVMDGSENYTLIIIATFSGGIIGFWVFLKTFFQSYNLFKSVAFITLSYAFLRLLFFSLYSFSSFPKAVEYALIAAYTFPAIVAMLIGLLSLNKTKLFRSDFTLGFTSSISRVFKYSKWVAVSILSYSLINRSFIFLVAAGSNMKTVAIVSASFIFVSIFSLINDSIRQILFPKISDLSKFSEYKSRIFQLMPYYFVFSFLVIFVLCAAMSFFFNENYKDSVFLFVIYSVGTVVTTGVGFYTIFIHTLKTPHIEAYVNVARMLFLFTGGFVYLIFSDIILFSIYYSVVLIIGEISLAYIVRLKFSEENI